MLKLYRVGAKTELHTDASSLGYGAILLRRDNANNVHFIPFIMSLEKRHPLKSATLAMN